MLEVKAKKLESVAILYLKGQVVTGETEILRNAVCSMSDVNAIILDLTGVTTIDAGGLGVMLELRGLAESRGIRFELMNVSKWVARVLQIVRLDTVFRITSSVEFFPSCNRPSQWGRLRRARSCSRNALDSAINAGVAGPLAPNPAREPTWQARLPSNRVLMSNLACFKEQHPFAAAEDACHTSGHQRRQRSGQQGS